MPALAWPRRARTSSTRPMATTTTVSTTNRIDREPCTNVLRTTASMASGVLAVPKLVFPCSNASRNAKCWAQ